MQVVDLELDLVNLRSDTYADSRIPEIAIGTPEQDALRRDLTINSLFYNINTEQVRCVRSSHCPWLVAVLFTARQAQAWPAALAGCRQVRGATLPCVLLGQRHTELQRITVLRSRQPAATPVLTKLGHLSMLLACSHLCQDVRRCTPRLQNR